MIPAAGLIAGLITAASEEVMTMCFTRGSFLAAASMFFVPSTAGMSMSLSLSLISSAGWTNVSNHLNGMMVEHIQWNGEAVCAM